MKIISLLTVFYLCFSLAAQKKEIIPQNKMVDYFMENLPDDLTKHGLSDLRTIDNAFSIRIWERHQITTLCSGTADESSLKIYVYKDPLIESTFVIEPSQSQLLLDSIIAQDPLKLEDDSSRGIDGSFTFIELSTNELYKVVSYWSPRAERSLDCKKVLDILNIIGNNVNLKDFYSQFYQSLPPGNYGWGMSFLHIDKLLDAEIKKTDFYTEMEQKLKKEFDLTDNRRFPLIIINGKPAQISDLNLYTKADITKTVLHIPNVSNVTHLYGTSGTNGVIEITTK